jgi:DNA-directed RNA polymerase
MGDLTQQQLNEDMVLLGKGRYRNKLESTTSREAELESKHGQRLMRSMLPTFVDAIQEWKDTVESYDRKARYQIDCLDLAAKLIGFISIKSVIDSISKKRPLSQVAIYLGARIEDELRCRFLCETNEEKAQGILLGAKRRKGTAAKIRHVRGSMRHESKKRDKPEWKKWGLRDKLNMGLNMVEILRVTTGIIEYTYIQDKRKSDRKYRPTRYVGATQELLTWIEEFNLDRELLEPFWLPTVEVPKDWLNVWDGGYDESSVFLPKVPFIKTTEMEYLRSIEGSLPEPMEAVNLIQQTPWKVNNRVLDTMKWSWDNNLIIGDVPNRKDEEFPPIPIDIKTNEEANRNWRRQAAKIYELNLSTKSRRLLVAKTLHLADKFKDERFFYPSQCDFRGRIYNIPSFLAIQGNDPSRALLEFYRPMRVSNKKDARWLAIHGANTFGNDKVTLQEREQWAYAFAKEAQAISDNPQANRGYVDADKPWQFLAWCFEWAQYTREGKINSSLPVSMDATNNGLQLLSLLMRDEHGAFATNVCPTDKPQDIYGEVAARVKTKLETDSLGGDDIATQWLRFGIDRKLAKRPTMVYPYGGTFYSCRAYVDEWYQDCLRKEKRTNPFSEDLRYRVTGYLARHVWDGINEVLDKPTQCMNWLRHVSEICTDNNIPINWITPTGFPVFQNYKTYSSQSVKTKISGQATWVKFRNQQDRLCRRQQRSGISPNFVHSLDAALLTKSVIEANKQGIYDFAMIHDSFGTHSNNCDLFGKILREQTSLIFNLDLLRDFRAQLLSANEGLEIPEPPDYGTFDPKEVVNSTYFFS